MNEIMTQVIPNWGATWGTVCFVLSGFWLVVGFVVIVGEGEDSARVLSVWGVVGAVGVVAGLGFLFLSPKDNTIKFGDAQAYVASETGQELTSKMVDNSVFSGEKSQIARDPNGECMKDRSCHEWYVKIRDAKWYLKEDDGEIVFWEAGSGQQFTTDDMRTLKVNDVKKKVIADSNLKNPSVQFAEKGPVLVGEAKAAGSKKIKVVGEYEGRLVEAYAGVDDKGDVSLVPMGASRDVTADDLMKK